MRGPTEPRVRILCAATCALRPLSWADECALVRFYHCGPRADARAFVKELLALSLSTPRRPADIDRLRDHERARLRCAFIAVSRNTRKWKALRGSHLSADERLFAVMLWRWEESERVRDLLRRRHAELATERDAVADAPCVARASASAVAAVDRLVRGRSAVEAFERFNESQAAVLGFQQVMKNLQRFTTPPWLLSGVTRLHPETPVAAGIAGVAAGVESPWSSAVASIAGIVDPGALLLRYTTPMLKKFDVPALGDLAGSANPIASMLWPSTPAAIDSLASVRVPALANLVRAANPIASMLSPSVMAAMESFTSVTVNSEALQLALGMQPANISKLALAFALDGGLMPQFTEMHEFFAVVEVVGTFDRRWQRRALYFILGGLDEVCDVWALHALATLNEA